jgi:predicted nucleic acid-binding protein
VDETGHGTTSTTLPGVFLDTNVLIYAFDNQETRKRDRAREVLAALSATARGAVSTQVLAEFTDVLVRRPRFGVSREWAAARVADYSRILTVVPVDEAVLRLAIAACVRRRWRIYDAQIWAAAFANGIQYVLTEDFEHGLDVDGVRFVDPFTEGFSLAALGLASAVEGGSGAGSEAEPAR